MTGTREGHALTSRLGKVSRVRRPDVPIMYTDVAFDVEAIQAGWPEFEARFDSLRGRKMMAVVFAEQGIYRLATAMRDEDDPRRVYQNIGPAFDDLHFLGEHDPSRPSIELYVRHGEVDCLLPVR